MMDPKKEAAIWRKIGRAFEQGGNEGRGKTARAFVGFDSRHGLCYAAERARLPSYNRHGCRVRCQDDHGLYLTETFDGTPRKRRAAAYHRAMTCYLMAEMVKDGRAPSYRSRLELEPGLEDAE